MYLPSFQWNYRSYSILKINFKLAFIAAGRDRVNFLERHEPWDVHNTPGLARLPRVVVQYGMDLTRKKKETTS